MRTLPAFAVAALAALALAVGLPGASATAAPASQVTSAATASPTATAATTANDITVEIAPGDSGVVKSGANLTATVTVHNGTAQALGIGYVNVFLDRATFSSRSQLESWFSRSDSDMTDTLGSFMTSVDVPAIKAGATSSDISITVPADSLALNGSDWGAKAFAARYSVGDTPLSEVHSSVVYYPNDSFSPTSLAIAVPITVPASTSGLISSDALANYTSPNGILTQELEAVRNKNVALGIDPMILASIRVLGVDAPATATIWLNHLQEATNETFALAYSDTDISALSQAGETRIPTPIDFSDAIAAQLKKDPNAYKTTDSGTGTGTGSGAGSGGGTAGGTATPDPTATATATPTTSPSPNPPTSTTPTRASLLAFPYTMQNVAWPLEDTVATNDLPVFSKSGYSTVILSSSNVKSTESTTENAAVTVSGRKALVADSTLSGLIRDASTAGDGVEFSNDMTHLSAELATLTHERPSDARTLFATLGRNWATEGARFDDTLNALSKLTWSKTVTMQAAAAQTSSSVSLASHSASDSRVDALTPLVRSTMQLDQFATALTTPALVTSKSRLRMLALSSTAWADNPTGLASEIGSLGSSIATVIGGVKVVEGSTINILGDRSSLPIVVQNDTASQATVLLEVVPSNYSLTIEKNDIEVDVQPNSQQRVTVPVQSVANGRVMLTLSLRSKQGVAISDPSQVTINVQAGWETAITLFFGIAVVLLFGGGIYRSLRRRRRAAAAGSAAAGSAGDGSAVAGTTPPGPDVPDGGSS